MKRTFTIMVCLIIGLSQLAKAQSGLNSMSYSGLESIHSNPARVALIDEKWSVLVSGVSMSLHTNYGFLKGSNMWSLTSDFIRSEDREAWIQNDVVDRVGYYDSPRPTFGKLSLDIQGPSFTISASGWHMGVITGMHFEGSATSIPVNLGYHNNYEIPQGMIYELQGGIGSGLLWSNIGLHLSRSETIGYRYDFSWGVNLNYLNGHYAVGIENHGTSFARKMVGGRVASVMGSGSLILSDAWHYGQDFRIGTTGSGFSVDVGGVLQLKNKYRRSDLEFGFALSDIGWINLQPEHTRKASINVENEVVFSPNDFSEVGFHPHASLEVFNGLIDENKNHVELTNRARFYTPACISTYIKASVNENITTQINWQQQLLKGLNRPSSFSYLAISGTYTQNQFEMSVPLTFMNYRQIWAGLALRYGPFYIGSDRLTGSILNADRMNAASIYAGVKFSPQTFPFTSSWWSAPKVQCPSFKF